MSYDYGFEYYFPDGMEGAAEGAFLGVAGIVVGVLLIVYLLALAFSVVSYVLSAVGMYRIAKRRGIHHAWLSWIPVGNAWLLGSISDHYQYVAKQKTTKRRTHLLILGLVTLAATGVFSGSVAATAVAFSADMGDSASILAIALITISYLAILGVSIAAMVISYIAYYDLFRSCKPGNAVLFLVLSIFFNVTLPFFVFFISNSDEGMPARRTQQPPQQIPEEPVAAEEEPAVVEEEIPVVEAEIVEDPE